MTTNADHVSKLEARLGVLEKRLHYLEDQEQIRECLARYGYAADLGRTQEWLDLWTTDGVYDLDNGPYKGREALTEIIAKPDGYHKSIENHCMHTVGNLFIRIDGDEAWAEGYSIVMVCETKPEQNIPKLCGYNHWDFRRVNGQWHLVRRYRRSVGGPVWGGDVIQSYIKQSAFPRS